MSDGGGRKIRKREEERVGAGREGGRGGDYESVCKHKFMALVPMQEQSHYQDREQQRLNRFGGGSGVGSST